MSETAEAADPSAQSKSETINMTVEPYEMEDAAVQEVVDTLPETAEKYQEIRKHGIDVMAKCKSEIMSPRMTPTHETGLNPVMSHSLTSDDPAAVFQIEEDVHEAIIDTGASRAVIGHERLSGLENGWLDQSGSCARSDSLSTIKLSVESS
ncbi:unnamed protein product [Cladocopium goreaui]|uniref:Uncharacterized protein n=1 Tax=Cladocopium goreaui TaxID=2562237 RepID=A0A9P1GE49_9DINO|nr:unnamed protein product [Cladocopium goreaui]